MKWDAPKSTKDAVTAVGLVIGFGLLIWFLVWYKNNWGYYDLS